MRLFVTAGMIADRLCSPKRDGQELLPQLIQKLVIASLSKEKIARLRFPHGDEIYLHGCDGILAVNEAVDHLYIPAGLSLWEMGTSLDPKTKANEDFTKAADKLANSFPDLTPAVTPAQATFVFVTSKPWEAGEWIKEQASCSTWKAIKVVDAVALAQWLESCPTVMLWFAEACGLPATGFYDADQYLQKVGAGFGLKAISPDLVIAGRVDRVAAIRDLVVAGNAEIRVRGESVEEAAAFLAAMSMEEKDAFPPQNPLVFADASANLNLMATFGAEMVVVPLDPETVTRVRMIKGQRWRLVVPEVSTSRVPLVEAGTLTLGRCKRTAIEKYLTDRLAFDEHRAKKVAGDTKGSLLALLWLAGSGAKELPSWVVEREATTHASIMLAGSWIATNPHDRSIVERLCRTGYREAETVLQGAEIPRGPWVHWGIEWICAPKDFVWEQLVGKITETMLSDFVSAVCDVLGERNPALDLPPPERLMARLFGKVRNYSDVLRTGLADSVARLATSREDGQACADSIVRRLLDPVLPHAVDQWLSLTDVYSELAEAAPDVFLMSLEKLLQLYGGRQFFLGAGSEMDIFGPRSPHISLLRSLECLAWQRRYLPHVLRLMVRLAEVDPGGNMSNRPKNSLATILLPLSPQHSETMSNAAQLLKNMHSISTEVAWDVSVGLLPTEQRILMGTRRPNYRDHERQREITISEYWEFVRSLVEVLVEHAGHNPVRWSNLVEAYPHLWYGDPETAQLVVGALGRIDLAKLNEADKDLIHTAIRQLAIRHRKYPDANWSFDEHALTQLENLQKKFSPVDLALLHAHMFSWEPDVPDAPLKLHENGWAEWIVERRKVVLGEVYAWGGLTAVWRLIETTAIPEAVGQIMSTLVLSDQQLDEVLWRGLHIPPATHIKSSHARATRSYLWSRFTLEGEAWLEALLLRHAPNWTAEAYANLALALTPTPALWARVEQWGPIADALYWQNVQVRGSNLEQWPHILAKWAIVKRPLSSLELITDVISNQGQQGLIRRPSADEVIDVLTQVTRADNGVEPAGQATTQLNYNAEVLFSFLDTQQIDLDRMVLLEWAWMRILKHTSRGLKILPRQITSSPDLFMNLLQIVFCGDGEHPADEIPADQKRAGAQAFDLLSDIDSVPGIQATEAGEIVDKYKLLAWVIDARKLAEESKRLGVCDSYIGQIFANSPSSPDGSWPCIEVRDLIEQIGSERMVKGLATGLFNKHGRISRGTRGRHEMDLATKYGAHAEQIRVGWPHTSTALEIVAENFVQQSKHWEHLAKRDEYR